MHWNPGDVIWLAAVVLIFGTGLVAVVLNSADGHIKRLLNIMERRLETKAASQDKGLADQVAALRQELAQLRDTSTQYDISIQHTLEHMQQRVAHLESQGRTSAPIVPKEEPASQKITLGNS